MLSFMLASLIAMPAHDGTTPKSDAQCFVALNAALEGLAENKDSEQAQQLSSAMFFYSGKLVARLPKSDDVWKLIETEAQSFAEKDFAPTLQRCSGELSAFSGGDAG